MAEINEIKKDIVEEIASLLDKQTESIDTALELHELGIDSLTLVELFVFIENNYELKLMESGISQEDLKTIDALSAKIVEEIS